MTTEATVTVDITKIKDFKNLDLFITETLDKLIDPDIRKALSTRAKRKELLSKYGRDAFIYPYKLKFPVINPETGDYDPMLIYSARARLRQYSKIKKQYKDLIDLADELYRKIDGKFRILVQINSDNETIIIDFLDLIEILI